MQWLSNTIVIFISLLLIYSVHSTAVSQNNPKIAVIGAGIGGTACSHFLRQEFGDDLELDLYEADHVGGRLDTVTLGQKSYDSGGTMIHRRNMYMTNLTHMLGLKKQQTTSERMAFYDGDEIVFSGSDWSWLLSTQMLWRYGWDIVKLPGFINDMLDKFDKIYGLQASGVSFTSPEGLLSSMDPAIEGYLQRSLYSVLTEDAGLGERIVSELGNAAMRTNYGQTATSTQGFVGAVSLAGIDPGLWRVQGGNKQVPEQLVKHSKANLISRRVTEVILENTNPPQYQVVTGKDTTMYDIVVIATPLNEELSGITFRNFPKALADFPQRFQRTVATFIRGQPNFPAFGYKTQHEFPQALLTINDKAFFNSIGKQTAIEQTSENSSFKDKQELPVWKVFSQKPLSESEMADLFLSSEEHKVVDWKAYPHYKTNETSLPPFQLHQQLYYINGIELCASAMEMSAIGAKNVALLAYNNWHQKLDLIDPDLQKLPSREEL